MAFYLHNNLAQKASISYLRPSLAFPQRAHSLSVCQSLQPVWTDHQIDPCLFPVLWLICEPSELSAAGRSD